MAATAARSRRRKQKVKRRKVDPVKAWTAGSTRYRPRLDATTR